MSSWPHFSNISPYVQTTLNSRKNNMFISELNCWVRIVSAVGDGLVLVSNPLVSLFGASGVYGVKAGGYLGYGWGGGAQSYSNDVDDLAGRPLPVVTSVEVDEGVEGNSISRKANLKIKCFTPGQLDAICEYFLEPGFTVFLEWGWNTPSAITGLTALNPKTIASYQNFENIDDKRKISEGGSDVYLGFIAGGGVQSSGTTWEVEVRLTGFTELPTYLMAADNSRQTDKEGLLTLPDGSAKSGMLYKPESIDKATDLDAKRFMFAYNALPSNMQTWDVAQLKTDVDVANIMNFINYDESVSGAANSKGSTIIQSFTTKVKEWVGMGDGMSSDSTKKIGSEKFIRFGALMKIMNARAAKGYAVGEKTIVYKIHTDNTVISAFPEIFSTDRAKLFIPNPNTPKPQFIDATETGGDVVDYTERVDNTVKGTKAFTDKRTSVIFPMNEPIVESVWNGITLIYNDVGRKILTVNKEKNQWGFLNDLYINADYAKSILDTKNFIIKDALYQILNGISSAAGGMWDFQIEVVPSPETTPGPIIVTKGDMILQVVDLNFISEHNTDSMYTFELQGIHSIFMSANMDLDLSGIRMNQVIAKRLNVAQNSSISPIRGTLFAVGKEDKILTAIRKVDGTAMGTAGPPDAKKPTDDDKKSREAIFREKIALYPHVKWDKSAPEFGADPYKEYYMGAYTDENCFESFKLGNEGRQGVSAPLVTPPMGMKFDFTVHGVSGLRRGDKFQVHGIPARYYDNGFWQIRSIKHVLEGMLWKTEVHSEYRVVYTKSTLPNTAATFNPGDAPSANAPSATFNVKSFSTISGTDATGTPVPFDMSKPIGTQ